MMPASRRRAAFALSFGLALVASLSAGGASPQRVAAPTPVLKAEHLPARGRAALQALGEKQRSTAVAQKWADGAIERGTGLVVVPAHRDAAVIEATLDRLLAVARPRRAGRRSVKLEVA